MNWLDFVLILLIGGAAALEMVRGFGRGILDALALYGALWVADALTVPLGANVHFTAHPASNHALAYGALFLGFGSLSLAVSRFVYNMLLINTGMFEGLLGLGSGLAAGMMLAHAVVRFIAMSDATGQGLLLVAGSSVGGEMFSFTTYHSVLSTLSGLTASHQSLPDAAH